MIKNFKPKLAPWVLMLSIIFMLSFSSVLASNIVSPNAVAQGNLAAYYSFEENPNLADSNNDFSFSQGYKNWYYYKSAPGSNSYTQLSVNNRVWWSAGLPLEKYEYLGINSYQQHPGVSYGDSVRAWKSTFNGQISISDTISDGNNQCGNGLIYQIYKNSQQLFSQSYNNGFGSTNINLVLNVNIGDMIYFRVNNKAGDNGCDSTNERILISKSVIDASSNGNEGVNNGALFVSGRIGQGTSFNGINNYIKIPDSNSLDLPSAWTIGAWVNVDPTQNTYGHIVAKRGISGTNYAFRTNGDGTKWECYFHNNGFKGAWNIGTVHKGAWHYMTCAYDGANVIKIYEDGILIGSANVGSPPSVTNNIAPVTIGNWIGPLESLKGKIDELKIWNKALTLDEINQEYKGLVAYYPFEGNANDASGNNNNGVVNGAILTTGKKGQAYNFNGVSNYIKVSDSNSLDLPSAWTLGAWVNVDPTQNTYGHIIAKRGGSGTNYAFRTDGSGTKWECYFNNNGYKGAWNIGIVHKGAWHYMTCAYDGANVIKIYEDGILIGSANVGSPPSVSNNIAPVTIGNWLGPLESLKGKIDEVKIWNYALNNSEINNEYNGICIPSCIGKQCGADGCGGSCGTCSGGQTCNANGNCEAVSSPFVSVVGNEFYLNGNKFYFAGANTYYLWYGSYSCPAPDPNVGCSKEVLDDAKAMNLTVLRVWGFSDGTSNYWGQLQPQKGLYNEPGFQKFDKMIKEAKDRNIKLIIPLVNNWNDFGGMAQYNSWCGVSNHDDFYTNACTKQAYKNYVNYVLNRVNSLTGIKYKDDPTIMAWELANEPRAESDTSNLIIDNWIEEMSSYIKSIDNNHLVGVGEEGWNGKGTDFIKNHNHAKIDFSAFHLFPNNWGFGLQQSLDWINSHITDGKSLGKPIILEEFGKLAPRDSSFASYYNLLEDKNINGNLFWMLKDKNYPDFDSYGINYPEDAITSRIISNANYMNSRNNYSVSKIVSGSHVEYRIYSKGHHFLSVINDNGVFDIRPHPGVDLDGWGSSLYMQAFLPGAILRGSVIQSITPKADSVEIIASGIVSQGSSGNYGTWDSAMNFNYNPTLKEINGNGNYNVNLNGAVNSNTGDLSLYKLASNYLNDVSLLDGTTGDTGDMKYAYISEIPNPYWYPPLQPGHFPQDFRKILTIEAVGDYNQINDARLKPAYKPSMNVKLNLTTSNCMMIFGGVYDLTKQKDPFADNVGITPLITKNSCTDKTYNFNVNFNSKAISGDGSIK